MLQFQFAPMPPPPAPVNSSDVSHDNDALASMLMAWYLSGYHTGYFQVSRCSIPCAVMHDYMMSAWFHVCLAPENYITFTPH